MNLSDEIEQKLLSYFANDDSNAFQSLTTIFEKMTRPSKWRESFFSDIDEIDDKEQVRTILDQMVIDGLLQSNWGSRDYEGSYRLTSQGTYEASSFNDYVVDAPSNVLLTESGEPLMTEDGQFIELEGPIADVHHLKASNASTSPPEVSSPTLGVGSNDSVAGYGRGAFGVGTYGQQETKIRPHDATSLHSVTEPEVRFNPRVAIDSAKWTGLSKVIIDARNAKVVGALIDQALLSLSTSQAGNFQIMQATAYLKAAKELVEAPEPPSEEIWRVIGRAADLVGLLAVFCSIFAQVGK